jgi:adenosylhomocysteine nucleosidase
MLARMQTAAGNGPIAFVCAMPMELTPLIEQLSLEQHDVDGVAVHRGTLDDRQVVGIVTGMGTALATQSLERLLDVMDVDHVVVVGITGAVDNEIPIGTMILPEAVVHSATGAEYRPTPIGDSVHTGKMLTGDELESDVGVLPDLRERGVVALDMETAATAAVCEERGITWSVFRSISDHPSDWSVTSECFHLTNLDNTPNHEAIEQYFKEHPERMETLAKLSADSTLAANAAADAAIRAFQRPGS